MHQSTAQGISMSRRRVALIAAGTGLVAHLATLSQLGTVPPGPLISDVIQFLLGIGATSAAASAARRSGQYAWKVWSLTAVALGIYTIGQGIVIYYDNVLHAPLFSPWVSDQFLFFWVVPLAMAALIDRWSKPRRIDWALVMDFSQVFLVALALHLSVFAMSSVWASEGRQLAFLEWQIRLIRDAIVLVTLSSKVVLSTAAKTRSLFLRIGIFFLAYMVADAFYLYAEAAWQNTVGGWLDLLWTLPRILLIYGAVTWDDAPLAAQQERRRRTRRQTLPLHFASILGPLLVVIVALQMSAGSMKVAVALVSLSFAFASIRFLITQDRQERATEELRSSRDLLEAVVQGTTEAVYIRDSEGRYLLANLAARRMLGSPNAEVLGRSDQLFFSEQVARRIRESDCEVIRTGNPQSLEESLELNGNTRVFLTRKGPYRDANGKVIGVLGIAVDMTERRKMEEELRKAQRMESIGTLAGGVAHDFNNLLTVIKGYSQLLLTEMADSEMIQELTEIDTAADRAASLTRQLLAFSRQQVMQPKVANLNNIVIDMQKMLRRLIGEDIDFSVRLSENLSSILADPGHIEQIVMNLAANARDAMPRGGKLTIETMNFELDEEYSRKHLNAPPGDYVLLAVSDTGTGMDEKTQARIFEPFFTTKPPGKGTGLGLSTVYGITKQSGGYIWVYSEVGHGSTFKMYFPAVNRVAESAPAPGKNLPHKGGTETILVVEDEIALSALVETSLQKKGYQVLTASSGEEAEAIAQQHNGPIHLLLSDVVMPHTNGREVAQLICQLRPQTRVLWMSGYPDDTIVQHGMLEPGTNFLQKPFTPSALTDKIREVLDKS